MVRINLFLYKIKIGDRMKISNIEPFVRYIHTFSVTAEHTRPPAKAYDNRLFFIIRGKGTVSIEHTTYEAEKNDIFLIPPGIVYQLKSISEKMECIGVNFDFSSSSKIINPIEPSNEQIFNADLKSDPVIFTDIKKLNEAVQIKHMHGIREKLLNIEKEYNEKLLYFNFLISHSFSSILFECIRNFSQNRENSHQRLIEDINEYVQKNITQNITNEQIAKIFNLHPNYINSIIKASTGISLHQYILHAKITYSVALLSEQKYTFSEIAKLCGFSDIYHYSKTFKKIMGTSPSKYF